MSDPLIRELDHYVVLEPGAEERILSRDETLTWLERRLAAMADPPRDLSDRAEPAEQALRLLETACELELEPGWRISWFAVRLEPPGSTPQA